MTTSPKILYVINHMDWFWSHRLELAQGAKEQGWQVLVASPNAQNEPRLVDYGFKGLALPPTDRGSKFLSTLKIVWALHNLMAHEKPDLVHAITLQTAFTVGLAGVFHRKIRLVHTLAGLGYLFSGEGLKPRILRALVGPLLRLALKSPRTRIIFQNPDDMALMIRRGFVDPAHCTLIRGSGVNITQFPFTQEPEISEETPPIVLMPTRLVWDKGVAIFVEAAKIVQARGIPARFQIAGGLTTNNPRALSKAQMEALVHGTPVKWLGKVTNMPALLACCTLVCYPSYYGEGVPKVLLEAAATGRAIITTDHAGCREAVDHEKTGLLVPIKNPQATADAIIALLQDSVRRKNMACAGRKKAENEFSVEYVVQETLRVYTFI